MCLIFKAFWKKKYQLIVTRQRNTAQYPHVLIEKYCFYHQNTKIDIFFRSEQFEADGPPYSGIVGITGPVGYGKTTVAVKFVTDNAQTFKPCLWVDASSVDQLMQNYAKLGVLQKQSCLLR